MSMDKNLNSSNSGGQVSSTSVLPLGKAMFQAGNILLQTTLKLFEGKLEENECYNSGIKWLRTGPWVSDTRQHGKGKEEESDKTQKECKGKTPNIVSLKLLSVPVLWGHHLSEWITIFFPGAESHFSFFSSLFTSLYCLWHNKEKKS